MDSIRRRALIQVRESRRGERITQDHPEVAALSAKELVAAKLDRFLTEQERASITLSQAS
ncbi:hypothetical protein FYK55_05320 [Roseiconus nitratireducens]|uniref:Uncharacterized protein n=1 Tax=Roseiconus nitratireducens TaxID=2605748 RepID=A0A5M6DC26_9BACT|nr:hypothetical protein [Roseiconus nitratireducens]KAA5545104.1 hypothetical protein FYK55_05320 [Roseiconus nitratireducens]